MSTGSIIPIHKFDKNLCKSVGETAVCSWWAPALRYHVGCLILWIAQLNLRLAIHISYCFTSQKKLKQFP